MLLLTMNIGAERYGIDAQSVTEIIPLVKLKHVPHVDACIKGIFNYRGIPVPVIDLGIFFENRECRNHLGSRIILSEIKMADGTGKTIGLLAEHVTEVIKCNASHFVSSGIHSAKSQFLQQVYQLNDDLIQIIDIKKIIPDSISKQLNIPEYSS